MLSSGLPPISSLFSAAPTSDGAQSTGTGQDAPGASQFLGLVDSALRGVSVAQDGAAAAESGFVTGAPGATLGQALVASDRAQIGWNATVAVRNEVVAAYQSIMSMQF
jgi:flagellar hook-basal body complex protein FliE